MEVCLMLITSDLGKIKFHYFHVIKSTDVQRGIKSVADPGFGRLGEATPTPEFGPKTYYLARVLPKTAKKRK